MRVPTTPQGTDEHEQPMMPPASDRQILDQLVELQRRQDRRIDDMAFLVRVTALNSLALLMYAIFMTIVGAIWVFMG